MLRSHEELPNQQLFRAGLDHRQAVRGRWQIELFFKWIKQHLLVASLKKRLRLEASLHTILQILSLTLFEKMPISQALLNCH